MTFSLRNISLLSLEILIKVLTFFRVQSGRLQRLQNSAAEQTPAAVDQSIAVCFRPISLATNTFWSTRINSLTKLLHNLDCYFYWLFQDSSQMEIQSQFNLNYKVQHIYWDFHKYMKPIWRVFVVTISISIGWDSSSWMNRFTCNVKHLKQLLLCSKSELQRRFFKDFGGALSL